jgi:hypothetical protein
MVGLDLRRMPDTRVAVAQVRHSNIVRIEDIAVLKLALVNASKDQIDDSCRDVCMNTASYLLNMANIINKAKNAVPESTLVEVLIHWHDVEVFYGKKTATDGALMLSYVRTIFQTIQSIYPPREVHAESMLTDVRRKVTAVFKPKPGHVEWDSEGVQQCIALMKNYFAGLAHTTTESTLMNAFANDLSVFFSNNDMIRTSSAHPGSTISPEIFEKGINTICNIRAGNRLKDRSWKSLSAEEKHDVDCAKTVLEMLNKELKRKMDSFRTGAPFTTILVSASMHLERNTPLDFDAMFSEYMHGVIEACQDTNCPFTPEETQEITLALAVKKRATANLETVAGNDRELDPNSVEHFKYLKLHDDETHIEELPEEFAESGFNLRSILHIFDKKDKKESK